MVGLLDMNDLIVLMVKRDLLGQYRGSIMGFFWTIINPLGHLLLYTFVFSIILKVRLGTNASVSNFALYLMAGLLPWGAVSETLNRASGLLLEQPNLVKRVVFPLEILPLSVTISAAISQLIGSVILIIIAAIMGYPPKAVIVALPLILAAQFLFVGGLSWLLGSLGVYVQDLRHMISLVLSAWMYATPIVYPATSLPNKLHFLLWINPIAGMVSDYRRVLLEGKLPDWPMFCAYTAFALLFWFGGYYFFNKTKRSFADVM